MMLSRLLQDITVSKMFQTLYGQMVVTHDVEVRAIHYDSRAIERGDIFVALRGTSADGNNYIQRAIGNGAKVVVTDNDGALPDSLFMHLGVVKVVVPDARVALAKMAATFYDAPAARLAVVGVTGTNGKTTTTHLIKYFLEGAARPTGLIGTIEYTIGDETTPATHTTPESLELQGLLARMVAKGCSAAVMEVSSHALHQHRVDGIGFAAAVFTNLSQDHLDYHGSMDEYFRAKVTLFDKITASGCAVINIDDEWGRKLHGTLSGQRKLSFGTTPDADVCAKDIRLSLRGVTFTVAYDARSYPVTSALVGRFNVSNILAALATGLSLGIPMESMQQTLRTITPVRGRFEQLASPEGWIAIVDYAHTPDALEKTLKAIRDLIAETGRGRIITVFGCGGNRDTAKRPIMGRIASEMSDVTIVTSDNPRREDPVAIIDDIMKGIAPRATTVRRETDRTTAVCAALDDACDGDVVLIAGKGHEEYQVVGDEKIHYSDREVVEAYLRRTA